MFFFFFLLFYPCWDNEALFTRVKFFLVKYFKNLDKKNQNIQYQLAIDLDGHNLKFCTTEKKDLIIFKILQMYK